MSRILIEGRVFSDGARQAELVARAEKLRPDLHRYCSRLMGSVIDGEDVVQDTLAKALVAFDKLQDLPSLRAWLFRVAHNRALDLLRSRAIRLAEPIEAASDIPDDAAPNAEAMLMRQEAVTLAISRFTELPTLQRSAIILKDVLDEPLADIAGLLDLTVDSVKAHLSRGRSRLRAMEMDPEQRPVAKAPSDAVDRYASLFNHRDWDGLRALLADDVKLHQSAHPIRVGAAEVGMFFNVYATIEGLWLTPAWLEGREVVAVFESRADAKPSYFMWVEWCEGRITFIRDYRYVRYVIADAELALMPKGEPEISPETTSPDHPHSSDTPASRPVFP
jgi:RNA polymerase sigma-70 factor (ECF subfamily)